MSPLLLGTAVGLLAGLGLVVIVAFSPPLRRPTLDSRLAPYLRDAARPSRLLQRDAPVTPFPTAERVLRPLLADAAGLVERHLGGSAAVRRRLTQLDRDTTLEEFRTEQVIWAAVGLLAALAVTVLGVVARGLNPLSGLLLCVAGVVAGLVGRDYRLSRQVARRHESMIMEFPTVAELLALAVAAGEGPVGAIERVTRLSSGELPRELRRALAEARSGTTLVQALDGVSRRSGLEPLARFIDGMTVAIERGTPLAEVLRAQAVDVRESGKRALLEAGGKKEIAMMVPVVFLVLPVTVVFALFPGLISITSFAS